MLKLISRQIIKILFLFCQRVSIVPVIQGVAVRVWMIRCIHLKNPNYRPSKESPRAPTECSRGVNPTRHPSLPSQRTKKAASISGPVFRRCNKTPQPRAGLNKSNAFPQPKRCTSHHVCPFDVATIPTIGTTCSGGGSEGNIIFCV